MNPAVIKVSAELGTERTPLELCSGGEDLVMSLAGLYFPQRLPLCWVVSRTAN